VNILSRLKHVVGGMPVWTWMAAAVPWIWVIPMNQLSWDDWAISANRGLADQFQFWSSQAKHPVNPFLYTLLLPLGAWAFHALIFIAAVVMAGTLPGLIANTRFTDVGLARWAAPFALVMPVFHARFSIATFEYSVALAALLVAWQQLLRDQRKWRLAIAVTLLVFAVGVPSLAIVYPLIYFTVSLRDNGHRFSASLWKALATRAYIVIVPLGYALVFQRLLNTRNKFRISRDGLIDFNNDLIRLVVVLAVLLLIVFRFKRRLLGSCWRIGLAILLSYLALFPYFAVGYKPLFDFMPWKMREAVREVAVQRLLIALFVLTLLSVVVFLLIERSMSIGLGSFGILGVLAAIVLGASTAVLGPMDWDSRHWLIAWPGLALLFVALLRPVDAHQRRAVGMIIFTVLAASSTWISGEYVVDSLKQRAIVDAVGREFVEQDLPDLRKADLAFVVVEFTDRTQALNARFRKYRPYEWWGMVADGLNVPPERLKLLEREDLGVGRRKVCRVRREGVIITPVVQSTYLETLLSLRATVKLQPRTITLCDPRVEYGWPRDP